MNGDLFVRHPELEQGGKGGPVRVLCAVKKTRDKKGNTSYLLESGNVDATTAVFNYLSAKSGILTAEKRKKMTARDWSRHGHESRKYSRARDSLFHILVRGHINHCLPRTEVSGFTRMRSKGNGKIRIHAKVTDANEPIIIFRISRGGDGPSFIGEKIYERLAKRGVQMIQVQAQRQKEVDKKTGRKKVVYWIKGKADLTGARVVIIESANASGGTGFEVVRAIIKHCASKPANIDFIFLNSCPQGIESIQPGFDGVKVSFTVGILHEGLNDDAYLIPGCGDCGAEDAHVQD